MCLDNLEINQKSYYSAFWGWLSMDFLWKVSHKILNSGLILKIFTKNIIGPDKQIFLFRGKLWLFSYPSVPTFVLGAQKNHLIEMVLLSTHNICFGWEIRKLVFNEAWNMQIIIYRIGYFLTCQFQHLLWVLKRTISLRQFFWVPTTYVLVEK